MPTFNGNFQYSATTGNQQQGPCRLQFDGETFTLTAESGPPLSFDLGDIDGIVSDRHQLRLPLYTGATLLLNQFGSSYDNLAAALTKAHRDREVQCLLLADMPETARFTGHFQRTAGAAPCPSCGATGSTGKFCRECGKPLQSVPPPAASASCPNCGSPHQSGKFCPQCGKSLQANASAPAASGDAELRLYKTNLAVLPEQSPGFQVRLVDVRHLDHEPSSYEVLLDLSGEALKFSALGKRTGEFAEKVGTALNEVQGDSSQALHLAFPFLNPDQLQQVATLLPEGSSAPVSELTKIDQRIPSALVANAVDKDLQPYYQDLLGRTAGGASYAGFKLIRPEDQQAGDDRQEDESESDGEAPDADQKGPTRCTGSSFPSQ
jgi:ribosomal protein L32